MISFCPLSSNSFNTQPPEGGWMTARLSISSLTSFNTQPPEGGWTIPFKRISQQAEFQHTAA